MLLDEIKNKADEIVWDAKKKVWRGVEVVFAGAMYVWGWVFPDPILVKGPGAVKRLPNIILSKGYKKVLVVTDTNLLKLGLPNGLFKAMEEAGLGYAVHEQMQANPSIEDVESAKNIYDREGCQAIIALGGGSSIDCAKGVMARVARPDRPVKKMKGVFMITLPSKEMKGFMPPPLFAIPTTAGTGSETTIASVITDTATKDKFPIMDPLIRAKYAVLDPELTTGLPGKITSTTGMDALTHAIEGYTNIWYNDLRFDELGKEAVRLIFNNLETAYNNPEDLVARENMLVAAFNAGMCFTRGGVGYVHGIGHRLGGLYHVPHGLAMAVILPHVFSDKFLGPYVIDELAELADTVGITGVNNKAKADAFVQEIREMNKRMDIPEGFTCIKDEDVPVIAERCIAEINPTYPVKHIFSKKEIENFIREELMI